MQYIDFPRQPSYLSKHVSSKGTIASIYEIQVTGGINMSQEGEGPQSDDKESFKELKDKS